MSGGRGPTAGRIRIIGGSLRNSRLDVPLVEGLRPTPERVRETLFNWLMPAIAGARCLDLCAGTGALGIEALSRGAAAAQFVEKDVHASQALRRNLDRLGLSDSPIATLDASSFLQGEPHPFDLVFLDPPFVLDLWARLAQRLEQAGWLNIGAWIYVELPRGVLPQLPANWQLHRQGVVGEVCFALYRRQIPISVGIR